MYMYISIYVNVCCGICSEMWKEGILVVCCELRLRDYLISTFTTYNIVRDHDRESARCYRLLRSFY